MLRSAPETAVAVGVAFEACNELYGLVADALVGLHSQHDTAVSVSLVSKQFAWAVRTSVNAWCTRYRAMQQRYAQRALNAPFADHSRVFMGLQELVSQAFGAEYVNAMGDVLLLSSAMDHRTYMHVQCRRCVLCGNVMPGRPERHVEWFVHAHTECAAKHCVPKTAISCIPCCVDRPWEPARILDDAIVVANHFIATAPQEQRKRHAASIVSKMSACGEMATRRSGLLWVRPHPAVSPRDTLLGALEISPKQMEALHTAAREIHDRAQVEAKERQTVRTRRLVGMAEERMGELAVEMLKRKGRLRTIADVEALHETASELFGLRRLASTHNYLSVKAVLQRVELFEMFTSGAHLGDTTYKVIETWLFDGAQRFGRLWEVFRDLVRNRAGGMIPSRLASMLVQGRPDEQAVDCERHRLLERTDEDCVGLRVRMLWPCATGRVHTHSVSQHSVRELRVMRTRVCDALCIDLPPIPHPQSPEYSDVSMAHALKQLVRACFAPVSLRPETHAIGLKLVHVEGLLWRLRYQAERDAVLAAAASSVPGGGDDESDTSGGW